MTKQYKSAEVFNRASAVLDANQNSANFSTNQGGSRQYGLDEDQLMAFNQTIGEQLGVQAVGVKLEDHSMLSDVKSDMDWVSITIKADNGDNIRYMVEFLDGKFEAMVKIDHQDDNEMTIDEFLELAKTEFMHVEINRRTYTVRRLNTIDAKHPTKSLGVLASALTNLALRS